MDLVGIVLGAGSSRRLGVPKQTLPLGDETVLGRSLLAATGSGLPRVVLVVGGAADESLASLDLGRADSAFNSEYGEGCASSLLAGLDTAGVCDGVVLMLGDMPTMPPRIIDAVIDYVALHEPWAAVTSYRRVIGHPFYFSAAAFEDLRALHGDKAVWKIVDREPESRVHRIEVDDELPLDIDTWADYHAVLEQLELQAPEDLTL